jgi:phosphate transport system protein
MYRSRFEKELDDLHSDLIKLGGMVGQAIDRSLNALIKQKCEIAEAVIAGDKEIGRLAYAVESAALKILLRQQPVASDLRVISTALKIVTDMERIGVQAREISSIVLHLCGEEYKTQLIDIPKMAETTKKMVNSCIDSFVNLDTDLAKKVAETDNEVDKLFAKVKDDMINLIREQPEYADQAIYLMMVAKYLEKIGDHAENIAEWVIFCKTGERIPKEAVWKT